MLLKVPREEIVINCPFCPFQYICRTYFGSRFPNWIFLHFINLFLSRSTFYNLYFYYNLYITIPDVCEFSRDRFTLVNSEIYTHTNKRSKFESRGYHAERQIAREHFTRENKFRTYMLRCDTDFLSKISKNLFITLRLKITTCTFTFFKRTVENSLRPKQTTKSNILSFFYRNLLPISQTKLDK